MIGIFYLKFPFFLPVYQKFHIFSYNEIKAVPHVGIHFVSIGSMKAVDVKYIPSEWEKTKKGIGDLICLGVWGKGMIDKKSRTI
ncbi:hypothetical protein NSU02_08330 [Aeribacillus sp. FSL W8-0870]|jgi:hypothetical protein|uniref:hypothetical protein n=1 Tax=Aeribacillus sp. FSL W8-0870 TaxID=2954706 RepID=UPI0030D4FDF6